MQSGLVRDQEFGPTATLQWLEWPHRASLVIRHAERSSLESGLHLNLTERGREEAVAFGRQLHEYDRIRLFYSPDDRCHDTAQAIAESAEKIGARIIAFQEDEYLDWITCFVEDRCMLIAERMTPSSLRPLLSGAIIRKILRRSFGESDKIMRHLIQRLLESDSPGLLDVNVSHDWDIMALREYHLGMRFEEYGLIDYLDGLVLFLSDGSVMVSYKPFTQNVVSNAFRK